MTSPAGSGAPDPKKTTRQYSRLMGLAFLVFAVFVSIKLIGANKDVNTGLAPGAAAPKFAAPSTTGRLTGPANPFQTERQARAAGRHDAACEVKLKDAIRVCDYFDKPLVLVIWSTKCGRACTDQVDAVERASRQFRNINLLGLEFAGSIEDAGKAVREHGWTMPIGVDEDGRVTRLYNVAIPPAVFFIYPGGRVQHSVVRRLDEKYVSDDIRQLVEESRKQVERTRRRG